MDELEYWRFIDEFSVNEAVLLSVGVNPLSVNIEDVSFKRHECHEKYVLLKRKLTEAIKSRSPKRLTRIEYNFTLEGSTVISTADWNRTRITAPVLKAWLRENKIPSAFFFPDSSDLPACLDQAHDQHPSKHAASTTDADTNPALEFQKDELKKQLGQMTIAFQALETEMESIKAERDALKKELSKPGEKSRRAYLNIIAALLSYINGKCPDVDPHQSFKSEAKLINTLRSFYCGYPGMSESNLKHLFPEAKRSLGDE
ncbi:MAG: hypothetical protein OXC41_03590 [Gammaproteobacteria bacterium]|nr:hypothetical protein [Gammaproteobacteria bacterium]